MKIISLTTENIKRLSAVTVTPDGNTVIIGGKNGAGKSSVLDSIQYALGGKDSLPDKPVREGESTAKIVVELDGLTVQRHWTPKGSYLSVTDADGVKSTTPQTLLDRLVGRLSFDPLRFMALPPKLQGSELLRSADVDPDYGLNDRQAHYDRRTEIGRQLKDVGAALAQINPDPECPDTAPDVKGLLEQQAKVQERAKAVEHATDVRRRVQTQWEAACRTSRAAQESKEREELALKTADAQLKAALKANNDDDPDGIREQIATAHEVAARVENLTRRAVLQDTVSELREAHEQQTAAITRIDTGRRKYIANAALPVEGLRVDSEGLPHLGNLPLAQASSAEQLRVSVAIGLASNPELRVLLIRDGSLLDEDSLAAVAKQAADADAQVWIERVGDGDPTAVIIEDGHVKGVGDVGA